MREILDRLLIDPTVCLPLSQPLKPVIFDTLVGQTYIKATHVNVSFLAGPFVLSCTTCSLEGETPLLAQRTKEQFLVGKIGWCHGIDVSNCYQLYFSEKKLNLEEVGDIGQNQTGREVIESECKSQSAEIAVSSRFSHDSYFSRTFISLQCLFLGTVASYSIVGFLFVLWNPGMFQQVVDVSL